MNNQDSERVWCFQATDNHPAVATRRLAGKGITLNVQSDVSCGGALVKHFRNEQPMLGGGTVPAQRDALKDDTRLVVGGMGGNTLGFASILKQCSAKPRGDAGGALPGGPVDPDSAAGECAEFFTSGGGKA
ncbi:hypothetical protein ACH4LT_18000 [Streptomyces clavifer]|uniref:hypothetical protein n=1 Tax=Streptomyces clavifer TaxID=68188 RepID=UPI00378C6256